MSTQLAVQSQIALQTPAEVIQAAINDPAVLGIRHDARIPFHALWKYWEWKRRAERLAADRKEALRHERAMNTIVLGLARHYVRERQASRLPQPPPALATPPASPLAGSLTPASLSPTAVSSPFGTTTVSVSTTSSFSNGPDSQAVSKSAVQLEQPILGPIALPIAVQVTNIIAPATPHAPASPTRSSESSLILADEVAGATDSASLPLSVYLGARVLPQYPPRPTALPIYPRTLGTDDLEPIKVLGQGGFGTVYLARDRATDTKLAVKVIPKERFAKYGSYEPVFAEQEVMRKMAGKKGFLPLHGSWHDEDSFYLATVSAHAARST
ncbi:hypothetical protein FA95DRAFT_1608716 [Auriscalpium vulgare]|uniref:Uncharacterized protein n=1 Tax=Auriscalpium vulgare TaxID=40419 RepID=A0ACB8RKG1_9AGAM|nr:hypothetical protein FA95DRAFT_1608716 [Auriscalpium vulgare]